MGLGCFVWLCSLDRLGFHIWHPQLASLLEAFLKLKRYVPRPAEWLAHGKSASCILEGRMSEPKSRETSRTGENPLASGNSANPRPSDS